MSRAETSALLLGHRSSAALKKQADKICGALADSEKQALLSAPVDARKYSWLALSSHVARLRGDPYQIHVFEDDESAAAKDSLELRDWFARTFLCSPTSAVKDGEASPRETFAVWRIYQERKHSNKVYIPRSAVYQSMALMGFVPHAADPVLVDSPSSRAMVTHLEYSKMQRIIRTFVRGADLVKPGLSERISPQGLDQMQTQHARKIAASPFSCLNGRAGTGKTTLVSAIVKALLDAKVSVVCLAPTHRAKKNLAKRLPEDVCLSTIDSYIKSSMSEVAVKGNRFFFVDEASMICLVKMSRLARAAMESTTWQVCLVGDAGQLEPIGRGEMFRTAMNKSDGSHFTLEKCYRAKSTDLFDAQTSIREGLVPATSESVEVDILDSDRDVEKKVAKYIRSHGASSQYIAWTNKTCDLVNRLVQAHERGTTVPSSTTTNPMVGDRVVYIGRNIPKRGLTNAMVGTVTAYKQGGAIFLVSWEEGQSIECPARDVALAYCLTVHKAQGSEFDRVCVVVTSVAAMMRSLDRRWLYTAASRAKSRCDIIATRDLADFVGAQLRKREQVGVSFSSS